MRHPSVPIGLPDEGEESPVTEPAGIVLFAAARRSPAVLLGLPDEGTVAGRGQWLLQRPCALRWEELDLPVAPRHRRVCRTPKTPDGDAACPTTTGYRPRGCYDSSGTRARAQAGTSAEPRVSRGRKREGGDAVIQGYFRTYRGALACMMFAVAASSGCARTGRVRSILPMRCLLLLGLLADARKIVAHPPEAVENWYSTGTVGAPAVLPVRLAGPFGEGEPLLGDLASALNGDASQAFPGFRDGEEVRMASGDHETFRIVRTGGIGDCKTARKPYSVVCAALLLALKARCPEAGIGCDDDCRGPIWDAARYLYRTVLGAEPPAV